MSKLNVLKLDKSPVCQLNGLRASILLHYPFLIEKRLVPFGKLTRQSLIFPDIHSSYPFVQRHPHDLVSLFVSQWFAVIPTSSVCSFQSNATSAVHFLGARKLVLSHNPLPLIFSQWLPVVPLQVILRVAIDLSIFVRLFDFDSIFLLAAIVHVTTHVNIIT